MAKNVKQAADPVSVGSIVKSYALLTLGTVIMALGTYFFKFTSELIYSFFDVTSVSFKFLFTRTSCTDTAAKSGKSCTLTGKTGQRILKLSKLNL